MDTCSLIAESEPPPCEEHNSEGRASVLLVADHASNRIPASLDSLGLSSDYLEQHIAYDIGSRNVVLKLAQLLDAPAILANYSRLVIDLNRSLEDPTGIPAVSDEIAIPGNQDLSADDVRARVHSFFVPYRAAIDRRLHDFRQRGIYPALIAIHSFTPEMAGQEREWQAGILWDKDPRIAVPLMEGLRALPQAYHIGDNEPYSGKHPADYTIDHHGEANGIPHVSIELRQDLIDDPDGANHWAGNLHQVLSGILSDPQLYRPWQGH